MHPRSRAAAAAALVLSIAPLAHATIVWNEPTNGDLSNDRFNPTSVGTLGQGSNTVSGSAGNGATDRDYFTFVVPAGSHLDALVVQSFSSASGQSFIGLASGTQVTTDPISGSAAGLLGWTHFGTAAGNVGTDILDNMAVASFGSSGFTIPLPAGSYSVWIQETGAVVTSYTFDFQVTPSPGAAAMLFPASTLLMRRRRSRP